MTSATNPALSERFAAQYAALKAGLPGARGMAELRERAMAAFARGGLPTPKLEAWRYTNLAALAKLAFEPAQPVANGVRGDALPWLLPAGETHRLAFVNGRYRPDLGALGKLPPGVELGSLAPELATEHAASLVGRPDGLEERPLLALNTALMTDGFLLRLPRGVALERPVELLFIAVPGAAPLAYHPRGVIRAESGSRATVIEHHIGGGASFANLAFEIDIAEGAALRHYKLQAEGPEAFHIATNNVRLARDARYESFVLSVGARIGRHETHVTLEGPGAECRLDSAYMGRNRQILDNTSFIDHASERTKSRQLSKGALDGQARGVFQGRVLVRPHAQKTDAHQMSRALLLAAGAEIDTKPQLEIYADDVKCGHGAAAGELDSDAFFYLRSRGIPEAEARRLLVEAFLAETLDIIADEPLREAFRRTIVDWVGRAGETKSDEAETRGAAAGEIGR